MQRSITRTWIRMWVKYKKSVMRLKATIVVVMGQLSTRHSLSWITKTRSKLQENLFNHKNKNTSLSELHYTQHKFLPLIWVRVFIIEQNVSQHNFATPSKYFQNCWTTFENIVSSFNEVQSTVNCLVLHWAPVQQSHLKTPLIVQAEAATPQFPRFYNNSNLKILFISFSYKTSTTL